MSVYESFKFSLHLEKTQKAFPQIATIAAEHHRQDFRPVDALSRQHNPVEPYPIDSLLLQGQIQVEKARSNGRDRTALSGRP